MMNLTLETILIVAGVLASLPVIGLALIFRQKTKAEQKRIREQLSADRRARLERRKRGKVHKDDFK
jgi:predicted aconitase with swiveling domain